MTNFNQKTILITGGAGFIGSNIAFYLQNNFDCRIVIFDIFRSEKTFSNGNLQSFGHYQNLLGFTGDIICGDIDNDTDLEKLQNYNFDYIFHQAAISDTRVYDQEIIMKTNVNSFYKLLNIAKNDNATMVYASSAATYGSLESPQVIGTESPENPYGFSKLMMDKIANKFVKDNSNMKIVGLRFFNVYGEREYFKDKTSSMIIQLGHQILANKNPKLFENSDDILRDFVYIDDVVNANILACGCSKSGVYNVGTATPRSFVDIVDILQNELSTDLQIDYIKNPYIGYQTHTQADISLSTEFLQYTPKYNLEQGIKKYIPYIKQMFGVSNK